MLFDIQSQDLIKDWSCHSVFSTRKKKKNGNLITIPFSDHRGMICSLNLDPMINERPDQICWNFDESKKEKFCKVIKEKMKLWNEVYEKCKDNSENVDKLVEYFQLLITTTAQDILGFKKYNSQSVNLVDNMIYEILNEKKKIKNKIAHLLSQMKKHFGFIKFAPTTMKRKLKRFRRKRNRLNKKLKKHKYHNMLKSTRKLENLINNPNVDKEKLFYDAIAKISIDVV